MPVLFEMPEGIAKMEQYLQLNFNPGMRRSSPFPYTLCLDHYQEGHKNGGPESIQLLYLHS